MKQILVLALLSLSLFLTGCAHTHFLVDKQNCEDRGSEHYDCPASAVHELK